MKPEEDEEMPEKKTSLMVWSSLGINLFIDSFACPFAFNTLMAGFLI